MPTLSEKLEQSKQAIAKARESIAEVNAELTERNQHILAMIAGGQYVDGHLEKAQDRVAQLARQEAEHRKEMP